LNKTYVCINFSSSLEISVIYDRKSKKKSFEGPLLKPLQISKIRKELLQNLKWMDSLCLIRWIK